MSQNAGNQIFESARERTEGPAGESLLSVVVIGPDDRRRSDVVFALKGPLCSEPHQVSQYPRKPQIGRLIEFHPDVVLVDLDGNPETALNVVEQVCAACQATVMVYSSGMHQDMMVRCMRAGAREYLDLPIPSSSMTEALERASARRENHQSEKRATGILCVFWGAKGGSGVTTIATNFAIAAAQEADKSVLLIDLDIPLGDAVVNLGLAPLYSTVDALQNYHRLDANYLSRLTLQHETGISILPAPGKLVPVHYTAEAVDRLIEVARREFDCVVVDSGSRFDLTGTVLFDPIAATYLVCQVNVPELRNSNRLVSDFFGSKAPKFEIVLNRYDSSSLDINEEHIEKVLTRKPKWKIPNDYVAVSAMQNNAIPIVTRESGISRVIRQMARAAFDLPGKPDRKKQLVNML
ncbi:nucleotide-binding protein [Occallatibacter riparius]|uniref:AAA family ATPase n=1 Tax=Occallatibacter riparius TaxID=1002689 RepID=A0A9J7BKV7_9BACT|nr:AAA family ATPase [Occallatibacter riparius]UWZ83073.1 AAA family ATPase [Occallatibacter riparius]